eukprot:5203634-Lingulodinium_polyedra.AAC.1
MAAYAAHGAPRAPVGRPPRAPLAGSAPQGQRCLASGAARIPRPFQGRAVVLADVPGGPAADE